MYRLLFCLSLIASAFALEDERCITPTNEHCVDARPLRVNKRVNGDNSCGDIDYNSQGICGSRSDRSSVWYKIVGNDKEVTVSACTNNDALFDYAVFSECNSVNADHCAAYTPQQTEISSCASDDTVDLTFFASKDRYYYVHVRSDVKDHINTFGMGTDFDIVYYEEGTDRDVDSDSVMGVSTFFALAFSSVLAAAWL